jgi:hypothetical protein
MHNLNDVRERKRAFLAACVIVRANRPDSLAMVQQALMSVRRHEIGERVQRAGRPAAILESIAFDMATRVAGLRDWKRVERVAFHYGAEMLDGYLMAMKESKAC